MALNTSKCNHLTPLHFKGLNVDSILSCSVTPLPSAPLRIALCCTRQVLRFTVLYWSEEMWLARHDDLPDFVFVGELQLNLERFVDNKWRTISAQPPAQHWHVTCTHSIPITLSILNESTLRTGREHNAYWHNRRDWVTGYDEGEMWWVFCWCQ